MDRYNSPMASWWLVSLLNETNRVNDESVPCLDKNVSQHVDNAVAVQHVTAHTVSELPPAQSADSDSHLTVYGIV